MKHGASFVMSPKHRAVPHRALHMAGRRSEGAAVAGANVGHRESHPGDRSRAASRPEPCLLRAAPALVEQLLPVAATTAAVAAAATAAAAAASGA